MVGKILPQGKDREDVENKHTSLIKSIKAITAGNVYPLLPLSAGVLPVIFLASSYGLGVTGNHAISNTPYPSDLGDYQPERGFFILSLSTSVGTVFPCIIFRYIQINQIGYNEHRKANIFAVICGIIHILGECLVFSFSQYENTVGHYTGALLYFLFGVIYITMQAQFSRSLPGYHPKILVGFRGFLALLGIVVLFVFFLGRIFAPKEENRYYIPQVCEWIIGGLFTGFTVTFAYDFNGLWCTSENFFREEKVYENEKAAKIIEFLKKEMDDRRREREGDVLIKDDGVQPHDKNVSSLPEITD